MLLTNPDVAYSMPLETFNLTRSCITCKHWDSYNVTNGYATCEYLVFASKYWKLMTRDGEPVKSSLAIVKTPHDFECRYWEMRE